MLPTNATAVRLCVCEGVAELVGRVASIWTWVRVGADGIALHPESIPTWFDRLEVGLRSQV